MCAADCQKKNRKIAGCKRHAVYHFTAHIFYGFLAQPGIGFRLSQCQSHYLRRWQQQDFLDSRKRCCSLCGGSSIDNPAAENKVIELGGPAALSPLEAVAIFETVLGNKFTVQLVPEAALSAQKAAAQDPLSESFAVLMLSAAGGSTIDNQQMMAVFPMSLTTVNEYAKN